MDLFATHLNHQVPLWFCQTGLPLAAAPDTLTPTIDRVVTLRLSPYPVSQEDTSEDQADEVIVIAPSWPKEVLLPPPDGMRDPPAAPIQEGSPVTLSARHGHALPHRPENSQIDCVEAKQRSPQDKGFSEAAIKIILAVTNKSRWKSFF